MDTLKARSKLNFIGASRHIHNEVHQVDEEGQTPLHIAAKNNEREKARSLLKHGADVSYIGVKRRNTDYILQVSATTLEGATPLHYAAEEGNWKFCAVLLAAGADPTLAANDGSVPLNAVVKLRVPVSLRMLQVLCCLLGPQGRLINNLTYRKSRKRESPLHAACARGNVWLLHFLVRNGANVKATTEAGQSPLHYAAGTQQLDAAISLIRYGADVDAKDANGQCFRAMVPLIKGWENALAGVLPTMTAAKPLSLSQVDSIRRISGMEGTDGKILSLILAANRILAQEDHPTAGVLEATTKLRLAVEEMVNRSSVMPQLESDENLLLQSNRASPKQNGDAAQELLQLQSVKELISSEETLLKNLELMQCVS